MDKLHWIICITIALIIVPNVISQAAPPPQDVSTAIIQKIDLEEKNTRKFISDELNRQLDSRMAGLDDRMGYYERTANALVQTATWKLGLIWAGITFFIISLNALLRTRIERKKFDKLKKALVGETTDNLIVQLQEQNRQIDGRFKAIQTQIAGQQERRFAQPQPNVDWRPKSSPTPPVMDYDGNPLKSAYAPQAPPTPQATLAEKVTFEQLQQLMVQYGLKPQKNPATQQLFQEVPAQPPPYIAPLAPRKLGFFERRRMAKLEKELKSHEQQRIKREDAKSKVLGQIMQLDPTYNARMT